MRSRLCNRCGIWSPVSEWDEGCPSCGYNNRGPQADYYIMPDIKPYQSMADGTMITSRSQHREHLKKHNCIEIGNETKYLVPKPKKTAPGLKQRIIEIARDKLRYK